MIVIAIDKCLYVLCWHAPAGWRGKPCSAAVRSQSEWPSAHSGDEETRRPPHRVSLPSPSIKSYRDQHLRMPVMEGLCCVV